MSIFCHPENSERDMVLALRSWEVGMGPEVRGEAFACVPKTENPEDGARAGSSHGPQRLRCGVEMLSACLCYGLGGKWRSEGRHVEMLVNDKTAAVLV